MENKIPKNSPAKIKANAKYQKNHYEQICLPVAKGTKALWREKATELGYSSLNAFIKDAINEKIKRS